MEPYNRIHGCAQIYVTTQLLDLEFEICIMSYEPEPILLYINVLKSKLKQNKKVTRKRKVKTLKLCKPKII